MAAKPLRRRSAAPPVQAPLRAREICIELDDHSTIERSAIDFFQLRGLRDPHAPAARLAEQFVTQNRSLLPILGVRVDREYDGRDVRLVIQAGSRVGAIPLFSPTTARLDYGLVVQPRFPWAGIGPMLAQMGWRVCPTPLRLPLLHRSERRVPLWVLSFMILMRLKALLDSIHRRFEQASEMKDAPRGTVAWNHYATRCLPHGAFLSIPCTFLDLREDPLLKGSVRYSVERQLQALDSQREHGPFVHRLIEIGRTLLHRVDDVPACVPSPVVFQRWLQRPMRTSHFTEGLQAIEWTVEDRGLAGLSDLEGIPWCMPMEQFFEAWIETVFAVIAQRTGGELRIGRKRETTHPITWEPTYLGSQKSLVPDIWVQWGSTTLIVDAKYKRHWEEMQVKSWTHLEEQLREQHRNDFLQVLAYSNLARTPNVIACLAYPCSPKSWESLRERGRLIHKGQLMIGSRSIHIWLTALPMATALEQIAIPLADELRETIHSH